MYQRRKMFRCVLCLLMKGTDHMVNQCLQPRPAEVGSLLPLEDLPQEDMSPLHLETDLTLVSQSGMIGDEDSSLLFCYSSVICIVGAFQFPFVRLLTWNGTHGPWNERPCSGYLWIGMIFCGLSGVGELSCYLALQSLLFILKSPYMDRQDSGILQRRELPYYITSKINHFW